MTIRYDRTSHNHGVRRSSGADKLPKTLHIASTTGTAFYVDVQLSGVGSRKPRVDWLEAQVSPEDDPSGGKLIRTDDVLSVKVDGARITIEVQPALVEVGSSMPRRATLFETIEIDTKSGRIGVRGDLLSREGTAVTEALLPPATIRKRNQDTPPAESRHVDVTDEWPTSGRNPFSYRV